MTTAEQPTWPALVKGIVLAGLVYALFLVGFRSCFLLGIENRMNTPPLTLFQNDLSDPVPQSVTIINADTSLGWQDPHYSLHFVIESNDLAAIIESQGLSIRTNFSVSSAQTNQAEFIAYLPEILTNWTRHAGRSMKDLILFKKEGNGWIDTMWTTKDYTEVFYTSIVW